MGLYTPHAKPLELLKLEEKERRTEYIRSAAPVILAGMVVRDSMKAGRVLSLDAQLDFALSLAAQIYDKAGEY